jgi:hypothetical protein
MKRYSVREKIRDILRIYSFVTPPPPEYEKVLFRMPLVCLYVCVRLASAWAIRNIVFVIGIWKFICHMSALSEYEHAGSKNRCSYSEPFV